MFGDKFLVVHLTVIPVGKLQRRSQVINYHLNRESQTKFIIKFMHMSINDNPSDIITKSRAYNTWFPLINHILFWRDMGFVKGQGCFRGE